MECEGLFVAVEQLNPFLPQNIQSCIPETVSRGQQIRSFLAEMANADNKTLDGDAAIVVVAICKAHVAVPKILVVKI